MLSVHAAMLFLADVLEYEIRVCTLRQRRERGEKPRRLGPAVVSGIGRGGGAILLPSTAGRAAGNISDIGSSSTAQVQVKSALSNSFGLERCRPGFVIGTEDRDRACI